MRKRKHLNRIGKMLLTAGILCFTALPVEAKVNQEDLANPIVDRESHIQNKGHRTTYHYVYFGYYPQREIKGDELTPDIINASYDEYGDGVVNGRKIRRLSKDMTTSVINGTSQFDDHGKIKYRYYYYEPIKWKVFDNDGSILFLVSDKAIELRVTTESKKLMLQFLLPLIRVAKLIKSKIKPKKIQ